MKRFIACLCFSVAFAGFAVPTGAQQVSLGVKAGMNSVTFSGQSDAKSYTRMIGGAMMVVDFGKYIVFQPELLYALKGSKMADTGDMVKVKADYLEVPLFARFQLPSEKSKFMPYALLGPTIAFNTSCKLTGQINSQNIDGSCDDPRFDLVIKSVDYGLGFGAGAEAAVGRSFVGLDVRYVLGLTNIDDSDHPHDMKNRAFAVMLGVRVPLHSAESAIRTY